MKYEIASQSSADVSMAEVVKANKNGIGVSVAGGLEASVVVAVGAYDDTTVTLKLQESDDNATYTDVAASDICGAFPEIKSGSTVQSSVVGYKGYKQYIRIAAAAGGTKTNGALVSAVVVKTHLRHCPE